VEQASGAVHAGHENQWRSASLDAKTWVVPAAGATTIGGPWLHRYWMRHRQEEARMTRERQSSVKDIRRVLRVAWALLSVFVVQSVVFGLAVLPAATFWEWHFRWRLPAPWMGIVFQSMAFIPAYTLFAFAFMLLSAASVRLFGWRTPPAAHLRILDFDWPLLDWGRYMIATHLVRVFAGAPFRASPLWPMYLRLNGARIGRGVFVNTLAVTDHSMLEIGDGVVIGSDVHMSGHTVEGGVVKTAPVRIGRNATIGVLAVIEIGVEIGEGCQVGALSFVPKFARLEAGRTYVGIPVRPTD
jgi:acetyltransferase-like isoleucine patch superfamily enzyme